MAAGDMLTANYQWQLSTNLYGAGANNLHIDLPGPDGLGVPDAKTQDVVWNLKAGSYANPDYLPMRLITIPAIVRGTDEATTLTSLKALSLAWVPQAADIDLAFQWPSWSKFYVMGRPRGAKFDFTLGKYGAIRVLLRFDCPDPTITYL